MTRDTFEIARIDLTSKQVERYALSKEVCRRNLGGRGLAGHLLSPKIEFECSDSRLPIVACTGPLVGTGAPSADGLMVLSRSPLTGTVGDTLLGGSAGALLKTAGLVGLVIEGRSEHPVGIEIDGRKIEIADATPLIGLSTFETADRLAGFASVISIGPAGERGVAFAGLAHNRDGIAGRSGLGALFGDKNLKYVALAGAVALPVFDTAARTDILRLAAASPVLLGACGFNALGTVALFDLLATRRMMPTDNFRATHFAAAPDLNAVALKEQFHPIAAGCPSCAVRCRRMTASRTPLPDVEALSHFTALVCNPSLEVAVDAVTQCHALGMDPITVGNVLAYHQERTGVRLRGDAILSFIADLAYLKGEGAAFRSGLIAHAATHDALPSAMAVKGLPLSAFDPRGALGTALSIAVATTGGNEKRANLFATEVLRKPVPTDRFSFAGKARMVKVAEDLYAAADALIACKHLFLAASIEEYAELFAEVSGEAVTGADLLAVGERIYYRERLMNARLGITVRDDDLPARFFTLPGSSGPSFNTPPIARDAFLDARARYYRVRGLDPSGLPTAETLDRLELEWNG